MSHIGSRGRFLTSLTWPRFPAFKLQTKHFHILIRNFITGCATYIVKNCCLWLVSHWCTYPERKFQEVSNLGEKISRVWSCLVCINERGTSFHARVWNYTPGYETSRLGAKLVARNRPMSDAGLRYQLDGHDFVVLGPAAAVAVGGFPEPGADCMRLFRPKSTDKICFSLIQACM
jgi:hypothetical protein